ncbi:Bardet-Biedl syndrome 4 protein homolog [Phlebotomus papatasi]|uniref:Bardet-Biedl syndrome 4 protein homolog n=1 Tax=Phlebotomus papatasi TaxID=29031 RepID=UPI002483A611|nr:Bardet-Biedl syndrome 4 protein homolog [Phlebotomus papatasi]
MNYYECNGVTPSSSTAANVILRRENTYAETNVNWLLYLMYARRDFSYCKLIIEEYLKKNYDTEYLYFVQGLIAREEGKMPDALKSFQKAIELNSKNSEYFKEVAKTLYKMGRFKQSLDVFLKAEALLDKPDHELYYFIGDLLLKNVGQPRAGPKEAKEYIVRGIQNGKHLDSYKKLAEIYLSEDDLPKAIEILENSLQINPDDPGTLTQIGILYLTIGATQNAFAKLLDALNVDAKCSKALTALGAILQSKNDVDGALNKYKLLSDLDQEGSEIWSNIGLCFYKKQKLVAAIACLKKAVWISPLNFNALYNLGYVLLKAHQFASAFHVLATAVSIKNNHAECLMLLGACLRYLHDRQGAFVAFERSTMQPDALKNPLIYLNFAIFCHEEGKYQQSRVYLTNVIRMSETASIPTEYIEAAQTLSGLLPPEDKDETKTEEDAEKEMARIEIESQMLKERDSSALGLGNASLVVADELKEDTEDDGDLV